MQHHADILNRLNLYPLESLRVGSAEKDTAFLIQVSREPLFELVFDDELFALK